MAMNKKDYQKPTMQVVSIQQGSRLLEGSFISIDTGDTGIIYGGGGDYNANARSFAGWFDE